MKFGKTIKIFLIDGEPNGRMTCELSNWSGKAYKVPRQKIKDCGDREELKTTGIYLLFGKDDFGKSQVYIGEAETVLTRLNQHLAKKDFWNETIIFVSKDENLNKAHIKYVENRLHEIAHTSNRYVLENSIKPSKSSISESDRAEMEEFIENIKLLVNTLGHKVFEDKVQPKGINKDDLLYTDSTRGAEAQGRSTSEGFLVYKGSRAAMSLTKSVPKHITSIRQSLQAKETLIECDGYLLFDDDVTFSSPSTAAGVVLGRSANGLVEWKNKNGITLKEVESRQ